MGRKRDQKIFWYDLETTGLDPVDCAITNLAALIEINGEVEDSVQINMAPFPGALIEDSALRIGHVTYDMIMDYPPVDEGMADLITLITNHISFSNREDCLVLAGYNIMSFDNIFLRNYFDYMNWGKDFPKCFFSAPLDVFAFVAERITKGLRLKNYRLGTVCEHFGIKFDAHQAIEDVTATRELYLKLSGKIKE